MRILIAEDDQVLADGLLRTLRGNGYAVDHVASGSEADAALSTQEFDLLILDLGLPRLHGFEVIKKMRGRGSASLSRWSCALSPAGWVRPETMTPAASTMSG